MTLRSLLICFVMLVVIALPIVVAAETNLVFCNTGKPDASGNFSTNCGFPELIDLAQRFINFLILKIAIPVAAVSFSYAGYLILTAAGNSGQVAKGKEVFVKVGIGLMWMLAAWLVVDLILTALLSNSGYSLLKQSTPGYNLRL